MTLLSTLAGTRPAVRSELSEVTWFRHGHEHRNNLLRFGLMRLARQGRIKFVQRPLAAASEFGFDDHVAHAAEHRHVSLLTLRSGAGQVRCAIDSEDSFFCLSPLIRDVDLYFCAGFNSDFFIRKQYPAFYDWQTRTEIAGYIRKADVLIEKFGDVFGRVRKFVPIGPNLNLRLSRTHHRVLEVRRRLLQPFTEGEYFGGELAEFEARYSSLEAFRDNPIQYDVVLKDSLWGWPEHRVRLHRRLASLAGDFRIRSELRWSDPVAIDGSDRLAFDPAAFPMTVGEIGDYEAMLARSRLAVFATGFHFGWRNIMMLALMLGLPVLVDRLVLEPWFDMGGFAMWMNESPDWDGVEPLLTSLVPERSAEIRRRNMAYYDQVMSPVAVADYLVRTARAHLNGRD